MQKSISTKNSGDSNRVNAVGIDPGSPTPFYSLKKEIRGLGEDIDKLKDLKKTIKKKEKQGLNSEIFVKRKDELEKSLYIKYWEEIGANEPVEVLSELKSYRLDLRLLRFHNNMENLRIDLQKMGDRHVIYGGPLFLVTGLDKIFQITAQIHPVLSQASETGFYLGLIITITGLSLSVGGRIQKLLTLRKQANELLRINSSQELSKGRD